MPRYHMHKAEREIIDEERMMDIIRKGRFTTISMCRGSEPYLVTLSYGLDEGDSVLYFHTAVKGLKLDFLEPNTRVCATVIEDLGYSHGNCSHKYRSVVIWGRMRKVNDPDEKVKGMRILLNHLEKDPETLESRFLSSMGDYDKIAVLALHIEEVTGKEST